MSPEEEKQLIYPRNYYNIKYSPHLIFIPKKGLLFRLIRSVWIGEVFEKEWNDYC